MSESLRNTTVVFLILSVAVICLEIYLGKSLDAAWPLIIVMSIYNVGYQLAKKLEHKE